MAAFFSENKLKLISSGSCLPGDAIDNNELLERLKQSCGRLAARKAALIARRLGIERRHFVHPQLANHQFGSTMNDAPELCFKALSSAFEKTKNNFADSMYLIGHTTTPYTLLPPNIAWVADKINHSGPYMELRQACTGFANALQVASAMLYANSNLKQIAVVGSEVGSVYCELTPQFMDQQQLVNLLQMGDGAGAVLLAAETHPSPHLLSDIFLGQIGLNRLPGFQLKEGGSGVPHTSRGLPFFEHQVHAVREQGAELFKLGLTAVLERGYRLADFRYILPHQVNGHIGRLLADYLQISENNIINDARHLGNMGSAAIWVSLDRLRRSGKLKTGDKVLVLGAEATKYLYGGFVYQH